MKKILLLLTMLTISHMGYSQLSVGVAGGFTHNTLDADAGYYEREYSPKGGYSIAIPVQYSFNDWFALRTELGYMTKSYSWDRHFNAFEDYDEDEVYDDGEEVKNGYLSIPIMAAFSYGGERLRAFVNVGGWLGSWLNCQLRDDIAGLFNDEYDIPYDDEFTKYEFDSRRDNRFDAGLLCGVGAEYKLSTQIGVFCECRYMYGLTNMQKSYKESYPRYNSTILAQIGVTYSFNLK